MTIEIGELEFSDRVLADMEELVNSKERNKMQRSKTIQQWVAFYKAWFSLEIKPETFTKLGTTAPGYTTFVIPQEVTLQQCIDLLAKKIKHFKCYLVEPNQNVVDIRQKESSYITYEKCTITLLELLVCDLFFLWQKKSVLPKSKTNSYKSSISRYLKNGTKKDIYVQVSMTDLYEAPAGTKRRKRLEYQIWNMS